MIHLFLLELFRKAFSSPSFDLSFPISGCMLYSICHGGEKRTSAKATLRKRALPFLKMGGGLDSPITTIGIFFLQVRGRSSNWRLIADLRKKKEGSSTGCDAKFKVGKGFCWWEHAMGEGKRLPLKKSSFDKKLSPLSPISLTTGRLFYIMGYTSWVFRQV